MLRLPGPLTDADLDHFVRKGYVYLQNAIEPQIAREWGDAAYLRLGYDPNDNSTWEKERLHMPARKHLPVAEIAPKAWEAIVQLSGGEDRILHPAMWGDAFIANFGERANEDWMPAGPNCPGWHKDGDFFLHFLDSPEQGLLVIPLWTDVVHMGGPTYIAPDSIEVMARYLADRPEGVLPNGFDFRERIRECSEFTEATGKQGDVYILHPYMLHAVSQNVLRAKRVITNPPLALAEPMKFYREDNAYSPIEQAVLHALGVQSLDFKATKPRERLVPGSQKARDEAAKLEVKR
jgi:hypothetical protein